MPEVRLGQPEMKESYNYYEDHGIKVYIVKNLEPKDNSIYVKLINFLGLKSFDVTGFKVI